MTSSLVEDLRLEVFGGDDGEGVVRDTGVPIRDRQVRIGAQWKDTTGGLVHGLLLK